jgi:hypothetical protein
VYLYASQFASEFPSESLALLPAWRWHGLDASFAAAPNFTRGVLALSGSVLIVARILAQPQAWPSLAVLALLLLLLMRALVSHVERHVLCQLIRHTAEWWFLLLTLSMLVALEAMQSVAEGIHTLFIGFSVSPFVLRFFIVPSRIMIHHSVDPRYASLAASSSPSLYAGSIALWIVAYFLACLATISIDSLAPTTRFWKLCVVTVYIGYNSMLVRSLPCICVSFHVRLSSCCSASHLVIMPCSSRRLSSCGWCLRRSTTRGSVLSRSSSGTAAPTRSPSAFSACWC